MYSGYGYTGTRVLETAYGTKAYEVFNFSQQATVDSDGDVWMVGKEFHAVLKVPKSSRGERGHRDGTGLMALFDTPTSIGVEATTGKVMVLDGGDRLRLITTRETADDLITSVVTIVKGACRSMVQHFILSSIVIREVWCHTQWAASSVPQEQVEIWQYPYMCVGHIATCGPRNHPGISDRESAWLQTLDNFTQSQNDTATNANLETGTFLVDQTGAA
ncbi:hypothetical protein Pmar_PMAR008101 [Perkinsus marinus ATCC 50983]|uniref:SMP-30/Gluconolactonase/LRE-like region domain-containing protein n=1 Tax=Perkinsus marinus (strain ATCC 50983 / TXsc) TaxID=423536 RepID=C5KDA6_PERM5|nr:hypothetical protein Pmar_PMAR008101 [Perkinsus marinus ATCC 50983]EER17539.1 hypothetical protein Pmar_PMAR008101 [Perkinsus marinus ATCC 50983]|eukprot:XP_002785743.1 hypothetical protein Pmar_PMAR008101 [Perkinsus marinus ATCC 50983]